MYVLKPTHSNPVPFPVKKPPHKRSKRKASIISVALMLGIMVILASTQVSNPTGASSASSKLVQDIDLLWQWSDPQYSGGAGGSNWEVRWELAGAEKGALKKLSDQVFTDSYGKPLDKLVRNEGKTVSGYSPDFGGTISIHLIEEAEMSDTLNVLFEAGGRQKVQHETLIHAVENMTKMIHRVSPSMTSSFKVSGHTLNKRVHGELRKLSQGKVIERLDHEGTASEFIHTIQLRSFTAQEGEDAANMQINVEQISNSKSMELTIGVPLIK